MVKSNSQSIGDTVGLEYIPCDSLVFIHSVKGKTSARLIIFFSNFSTCSCFSMKRLFAVVINFHSRSFILNSFCFFFFILSFIFYFYLKFFIIFFVFDLSFQSLLFNLFFHFFINLYAQWATNITRKCLKVLLTRHLSAISLEPSAQASANAKLFGSCENW